MTLHLAFTNFLSENIKLASLETARYTFFATWHHFRKWDVSHQRIHFLISIFETN